MNAPTCGSIIYSFFLDYLPQQKGLRPGSIRSYRDTMRLFLTFASARRKRSVTELKFEDLTFECVLDFLRDLEQTRHNKVATRNQRLAALHTFYEYIGRRMPEMLRVCEQVSAIPMKRSAQPEARFMAKEEVQRLFDQLPQQGSLALRDRALFLFLYNTGARVTEVSTLRREHLVLTEQPHVRLLGKGGKWRTCPLWKETARALGQLLSERGATDAQSAVFAAGDGSALTRFGIYKRVRRYAGAIEQTPSSPTCARRIGPHVFRHTAAVHLLEAGVEVNVIRGWLGHVSLDTTHRYAEITLRMKEEALRLCEPPVPSAKPRGRPTWHGDAALMSWLASL